MTDRMLFATVASAAAALSLGACANNHAVEGGLAGAAVGAGASAIGGGDVGTGAAVGGAAGAVGGAIIDK